MELSWENNFSKNKFSKNSETDSCRWGIRNVCPLNTFFNIATKTDHMQFGSCEFIYKKLCGLSSTAIGDEALNTWFLPPTSPFTVSVTVSVPLAALTCRTLLMEVGTFLHIYYFTSHSIIISLIIIFFQRHCQKMFIPLKSHCAFWGGKKNYF